MTTTPFFEQMLAEYRKGLEWREDYDDFMDSLNGRGGICAPDAAAEYADELSIPIGELELIQTVERDLRFTMELQRARPSDRAFAASPSSQSSLSGPFGLQSHRARGGQ